MIVYLSGSFVPREDAKLSPDDRGFLLGDGIYEVIRSYRGRFLEAEAHLDRMRRGLREIKITGWDSTDFLDVAASLLNHNGLADEDALIYMQVTRGAPPTRTHAFPDPPVEPTVYVTVFPYVQKADPEAGVSMITTPDIRWGRCDLKTIGLLANCLSQQQARENGAFDSILVRNGLALESSASSFFAVVNGVVITAPKTRYILPSITRAITLKICAEGGIPTREEAAAEDTLSQVDEMFLAGTTLEILPIVKLNGVAVGNGKPGAITTDIRELFRNYVLSATDSAAPTGSQLRAR